MRWSASPTTARAAQRHERYLKRARHRAQLRRASVDERFVFRARAAAQLSRLEGQRLHVLRRDGAKVLHDEGVLCEPDSREPWFVSAAHDDSCLKDTWRRFEIAVDATLKAVRAARKSAGLNARRPV
jgi:glutamate-1-semialdehyde aminotransferase